MKKRAWEIMIAAFFAAVVVMCWSLCVWANETEQNSVPTEPQNGIPLVIVYVDESEEAIAAAEEASSDDPAKRDDYGTIAEMNSSEDHSVRCTGTIEIKVPEGFAGEYGNAAVPAGEIDLEYIRGRGNSTWGTDPDLKKPYKIKFKSKRNLFNMGKNKEWALMANTFDGTLLKNRIVSWFGERMGFAYTPQMIPVDVVMIGSESGAAELGSYCLSELVSTGSGRLDIDGAKLLAYYTNVQNEGDPYFTTNAGIDLKFEDPEEVDLQVEAFINDLEAMIIGNATIDAAAHAEIAEKMDLEAAADYWWIQEFTCNGDAFGTSSTYLYIDPNPAWKLFWGPLWDFDGTFSDVEFEENAVAKYGFNNNRMLWFDKLRENDPQFADMLKERWNGTDDSEHPYPGLNQLLEEMTRSGGELDRMKEQIRASWDWDHAIWWERTNKWGLEERDIDREIEDLRIWIDQRRAWINENLDMLGEVYHTVTYMVDGSDIGTETVRDGDNAEGRIDPPDKDGYLFVNWRERQTGRDIGVVNIMRDTVFDAVFIREEEAVKPAAIYFGKTEDWVDLNQKAYDGNWTIILPDDAVATKATWTSSDKAVASVGKDGCVTLLSAGDTTIKLTMYNGVSASYVLHVYDPDKVTPVRANGVIAKPKELTLKVGETKQISCCILPEGGAFKDFWVSFQSDGSGCIRVEEDEGVITGLKPGKAIIKVILKANDGTDEFTDQCIVKVVKEASQITLKGTGIRSLKKGKKAITVKWKKQSAKISRSHITGYQTQLATDKKFSKNRKTVTVKGYKKTSKKVTKLKGGRKYYVRIRTYKRIKGTNYYSPWSKAKAIRTQ